MGGALLLRDANGAKMATAGSTWHPKGLQNASQKLHKFIENGLLRPGPPPENAKSTTRLPKGSKIVEKMMAKRLPPSWKFAVVASFKGPDRKSLHSPRGKTQ